MFICNVVAVPMLSDPNKAGLELMLPWLVNRTLDSKERENILRRCESDPALMDELVWLQRLRADLQAGAPSLDFERGLAALLAKVDAVRATDED